MRGEESVGPGDLGGRPALHRRCGRIPVDGGRAAIRRWERPGTAAHGPAPRLRLVLLHRGPRLLRGAAGVELVDLRVTATGVYDGPSFASVRIEVSSGCERAALRQLITAAEKVCYVTNTLRRAPDIEIALAEERNRADTP
ncbi:OsmC family protein [Streptomyces chiangmaiensis]